MTRKDYVAIAQAIKEGRASVQCSDPVLADIVALGIANRVGQAMARDNPRFDHHRFLTACGLGIS